MHNWKGNFEPLKLAAGKKEVEKMRKDVRTNMNANGNLIEPKYTKKPIVYEATGAMGEETKDMMEKVMLKLREVPIGDTDPISGGA